MIRGLLVLALLPLAGCATGSSIQCPPLVKYPAAVQNILASELPKDGPESQAQIEDYIKLRQACRTNSAQ